MIITCCPTQSVPTAGISYGSFGQNRRDRTSLNQSGVVQSNFDAAGWESATWESRSVRSLKSAIKRLLGARFRAPERVVLDFFGTYAFDSVKVMQSRVQFRFLDTADENTRIFVYPT